MYIVRSPQPLTKETANANAATAAASAFMRRASDASLSSAAAAAALKARPTSPTIVADVQSKRVSRRSPSASSATGTRRQLTRTPSAGSMMERTFRSPSPGRSPAPVSYDVPPIPSIPNTDNYTPTSQPTSGSRKSGLQTQTFRTASEKIKAGQQGSWFGAATAHDLHSVRRTTSELQLSSARAPQEPRPGSVSPSINFSYPRARLHLSNGSLQSLKSLQTEDQTLVYDPNSRRMVPKAQVQAQTHASYDEYYDDETIQTPQTKKQTKRPKEPKQPRLSRAGSHLARGTVGRTKAPVLENKEKELQPPSGVEAELGLEQNGEPAAHIATQIPIEKKKKRKKKRVKPGYSTKSHAAVAEDQQDSQHSKELAQQPTALLENVASSASATGEATEVVTKPTTKMNGTTSPSNSKSKVQAMAVREPSESPARSARFASSADQLVVRHEPPPRSLSPRKSALKHSSPTRAVSPSDDGSEACGIPTSLSSNDDARKKGFRVSWDDRNTVVVTEPVAQHAAEQAASSSPQTKRPWLNIVGKGIKKETISVEKEETMSPRPALPSFGSVREKKPKEQEERPLVRPDYTLLPGESMAAVTSAPTLPIELSVEPNTSKHKESLSADLLPSIEKDEVSSSDDGLMEDTSDEDHESHIDLFPPDTNGTSTRNNAGSEKGVPWISTPYPISRASDEAGGNGVVSRLSAADDQAFLSNEDPSRDSQGLGAGLQMDDIKEEEEEAEMYSDAYEEIAEPDDKVFLSLDAVLESPTVSPNVTTTENQSKIEQQDTQATEGLDHEEELPDDWENAKAFWKSLSSERRRQLEQEAMEEADEDRQDKLKSEKAIDRIPAFKTDDQIIRSNKDRIYQITPGSIQPYDSTSEPIPVKWELPKSNSTTLRKSMREGHYNGLPNPEPPKQGASLQKPMRPDQPLVTGMADSSERRTEQSYVSSGSRMKKSLRQNSRDISPDLQRPLTDRPATCHAPSAAASSPVNHSHGRQRNGFSSPASTGGGVFAKAGLRRRGSDSSESSFTRARAGSAGEHEFRKSMRTSMRSPAVSSEHINESKRLSLRALSPPSIGLRRNSGSSIPPAADLGVTRMRRSLRVASADPPVRKRLSTLAKSTTGKTKKGKSGSRFDDSSDEDEGPMKTIFFRSRFADSSSDDESNMKIRNKGLPKSLRGKSAAQATSSAIELPFTRSEHEFVNLLNSNVMLTQPKRAQIAGGQLQQPQSGHEPQMSLTQLEANGESGRGSLRPQHNRRGSFISLLRRKKDPAGKISRELTESAARQNTSLERSAEELKALRNQSFHKRGPSWPLPEPEEIGSTRTRQSLERPSTAGEAIVSDNAKSNPLRRRSASQGMVPTDVNEMEDPAVEAMPQKKKKFGTLRKMFGLHD